MCADTGRRERPGGIVPVYVGEARRIEGVAEVAGRFERVRGDCGGEIGEGEEGEGDGES